MTEQQQKRRLHVLIMSAATDWAISPVMSDYYEGIVRGVIQAYNWLFDDDTAVSEYRAMLRKKEGD